MRLISFKKYIAILLAIWLVIVIAGLIFSRSMQDKIINILSEQVSKHLTTEIHIRKGDIHFSVIKKFPHAAVELRNVCFKVPPSVNLNESLPVKGDTLLFAKSLFLQLNLKSLINKKYDLEKISLRDGYLHILSDKKGNSSLNIVRKKENSDSSKFAARIEAFAVNNLTIYTSDQLNNSQYRVFIKQGNASGSFSRENFFVKLKSNGKLIEYQAKGQQMAPNQSFAIDTDVEFSNGRYTVNRGSFNFSNIPFTAIGTLTPGDNTLVDLIFSAKQVPLKQIDKTVLRGLIGESGFVPKGGFLDIQATFIGYTRYNLPAIKASFSIDKGKVFDQKRKLTYQNIHIVGNADNGKQHLPRTTTVRIDSFRFQAGESWQTGKLKIHNLTDPTLTVSTRGKINLSDVEGIINIPDVQLVEGTFTNNVGVKGTIKRDNNKLNNLLDDIQIRGNVSIQKLGLVFEKYKIPYTVLKGDVNLRQDLSLQFDSLSAKSGHSDILINGRLSHVLRKSGIPKFTGNVYSDYFLADDFISPSNAQTKVKKVLTFPDSLIVNGSAFIKEFKFGSFETQEIKGNIHYQNKKLTVNPFYMNAFDGKADGILSLEQYSNGDIKMNVDGSLARVNIRKLFEGCNNFSQSAISAEHIGGKLSGKILFQSSWTNKLKFIPSSLSNVSNITIVDGELIEYQPLMGLSRFIDVSDLSHIKFDKLKTVISISEQQIYLDQTNISSSAITFDGSGVHGFDSEYEYRLQLGLSDVLWGKAKKKKKEANEFGYVVDDGVGHTMLPIILYGKGTEYNVKWDKKKSRSTFKQKLQEERQELKELFKGENIKADSNQNQFKIETDETPKKSLQKTDSGTYKVKTRDHEIIWDDSPDEDDEDEGLPEV